MAAPTTPIEAAAIEHQVLDVVRDLLEERRRLVAPGTVSLHSHLQRDLGLGRLDLIELTARCEAFFEIALPSDIAMEGETPAAWVDAIRAGEPAAEAPRTYHISPPRADALGEPSGARSLIDAMVHHAEADPGRVHIHLLEGDSGQGITYGRLYDEASAVAAGLADQGLERNETVAIMLPSTADFFYAFFGVILAGGIPVPVYPPTRPDRIEEYVRRQIVVLRRAAVRFLITFPEVRPVVQILRVNLPTLVEVTNVNDLRHTRARLGAGSVRLADHAVLQFTSGSTGDPKAVALSHEAVLANIRGIGRAVEVRPGDALVTWLPLYSDLGLIGCWLFAMYWSAPITVLSPLDFLQRPERWLRAIHETRGTLSAGPNFAYELCTRRIPASALEGIDLSSWRVAVNAGEPVLVETVDRFTRRFSDFGFRSEAMLPCFGLSESTVALTVPPPGRLPVRDRIDRGEFERNGRAVPASTEDPSPLTFFSTGEPIEGQRIRLVDDEDRDVGERILGRLLFRGRSTMTGYFRNPQATRTVVREDGWLDSGDYGYLAGGEFFFTGRSREAIVKAGRSVHPFDVETAVGAVAGVLSNSAVAFGAPDSTTGAERLIVTAETRATSQEDFRRIEAEIVRVVDEYLGMPPDRVQLVEPGCLPRTQNGKLRRNEIRALYESGRLRTVSRPPWRQLVRLRWENLGSLFGLSLKRTRLAAGRNLTGSAVASIARVVGAWTRLSGNKCCIRPACRWILGLFAQRYSVQGQDWPANGLPTLYVANRSGTWDPLIVAAAFPDGVRFADVAAINGLPPAVAWLMRPLVLGHEERQTVPMAGELRHRIHTAFEHGLSVVAFPENQAGEPVSRTRFRLDPFQAALETGTPIHPTAVRRRTLPQTQVEHVRVRRVTLVVVREAVETGGGATVRELRDRVREAIGEYHA